MSRQIKSFPKLTFDAQNLTGRADFEYIFGRCAPLHVEIGSGKGTFLVNQARFQPEDNFLGIEWGKPLFPFCD